jgi:16S rRNA (guanine966-N2)-methyltransferase
MPGPRVIAGTAKSRRLHSVPGDTTRPITDRAKESLFNIIGSDIVGAAFLDLFAGTGSVGIEALSRGASFALFLDINRQAVETLRSNLKITGLTAKAAVKQQDALKYLFQTPDRTFDYAFVAPPQYKGTWSQVMFLLDEHPGWLSADAWVIAQIHPVEYEMLQLTRFEDFDQRKYGSVMFLFYRLLEQAAD